ncbi:MAG TPA: hypothetical protein VFY88_15000 [Intrasporangium sp.]|nr:hypothetical protein [Intrasporangium sp.]
MRRGNAGAVERRDRTGAGAAFAEYVLPSPGLERLRRLGGPGKGHVATCSSAKVAGEVLGFVGAQGRSPA